MKKVLFVFMIFMLHTFQTSAQEKAEKSKYYIGITGGVSAPVGAFGSTDTTSENAGLARAGYNLNLNAAYHINDNFGLASSIFYSRFKLDQTAIGQIIETGSITDIHASADHWQYLGLEVGPTATIPVNEKIFIDFKGLLGIAYANMPVYRFELSGLPSLAIVTNDEWDYSFTWRLGTGMRYNFGKGFCFLANADYNYLKPTWKYDVPSDGGTQKVEDEQKIGSLDLNVGFGVTF